MSLPSEVLARPGEWRGRLVLALAPFTAFPEVASSRKALHVVTAGEAPPSAPRARGCRLEGGAYADLYDAAECVAAGARVQAEAVVIYEPAMVAGAARPPAHLARSSVEAGLLVASAADGPAVVFLSAPPPSLVREVVRRAGREARERLVIWWPGPRGHPYLESLGLGGEVEVLYGASRPPWCRTLLLEVVETARLGGAPAAGDVASVLEDSFRRGASRVLVAVGSAPAARSLYLSVSSVCKGLGAEPLLASGPRSRRDWARLLAAASSPRACLFASSPWPLLGAPPFDAVVVESVNPSFVSLLAPLLSPHAEVYLLSYEDDEAGSLIGSALGRAAMLDLSCPSDAGVYSVYDLSMSMDERGLYMEGVGELSIDFGPGLRRLSLVPAEELEEVLGPGAYGRVVEAACAGGYRALVERRAAETLIDGVVEAAEQAVGLERCADGRPLSVSVRCRGGSCEIAVTAQGLEPEGFEVLGFLLSRGAYSRELGLLA